MKNDNKNAFLAKVGGFFHKLFHPTGSRHGTIAAGMIALVIIIVLFVNLALGSMKSTVLDLDISDQSIYEITEVSQEYAAGLQTDIDIILLAVEDDIDIRLSKFIHRYAEMNDCITVSSVNPVTTPSVLETYDCEANTVVVKNHATGKFTTIPMTGTEDGAFIVSALNYNTYSYEESYFDGEGLLTAAIEYVTTESSNIVYCLTGHDEVALSTSLQSLIRKANISLGEDVDLLMDGGIPQDCDTLIINNPVTDLAEDEVKILEDYLSTGGNVTLLLADSKLENFNTLLADYGMAMLDGYLGDQTRYYNQ